MKKIMFDDKCGLTKAVLEGRKTMTRRIISGKDYEKASTYRIDYFADTLDALSEEEALLKFSPYKVGEVVAVAQCYLSIHNEMMDNSFGEGYEDAIYDPFRWAIVDDKPGWSNKMFVYAGLMPHHIRITNVRVERLQDISDEDCLREGVDEFVLRKGDGTRRTKYSFKGADNNYLSPRDAFASLIDKLSGKGTWASNPWVFVYEFELVK